MLGDKEAVATLAVKDLGAARKFYEGKLGLKPVDTQGDEAVTYKSGSSTVIVYRSQYAGTNKATAANWLWARTSRRSSRAWRSGASSSSTTTCPG